MWSRNIINYKFWVEVFKSCEDTILWVYTPFWLQIPAILTLCIFSNLKGEEIDLTYILPIGLESLSDFNYASPSVCRHISKYIVKGFVTASV